jgi:aminoglycoside phosphotransferase family enzyme/predicted kinase
LSDVSREPKAYLGPTDGWLVQALTNPETYGIDVPVLIRETHASRVFLAGEWAYKVKKPVRLAFLDYGTLERRRVACRQELEVNRDLGAPIYVDVVAIVRDGDRVRFAPEETPGAIEYAIRMRRFDESRTLKSRIGEGALARGTVAAVAQRLAAFHESAPVCDGGGAQATLAAWEENLRELELLAGERVAAVALRRFGRAFVAAHAAEVELRARAGRVRDGHGDLRCEHVLLDGQVHVVDRIEFDPDLRQIDVGCDLAFLVMDLLAEGQQVAARWLVAEYRHAGGDPGGDQLICFYAAHWALVRAKVDLLADGSDANRLMALADRLCWRARAPLAVVLAGPAASGKSTLASALSERSGWLTLSSDETRKRLAGLAATQRAPSDHYTDESTRRTYRALAAQAAGVLACGAGVVLDASCTKRFERAELLAAVGEAGAPALLVHCNVTLPTALARAAARMREPDRVSDATPEVVAAQFQAFEAIDEAVGVATVNVDCEAPLARQLETVTDALDRAIAARGEQLPAAT